MKYINSIIIFFFLHILNVSAQNISISISAPKVAVVGELFQVCYSINTEPSNQFSIETCNEIQASGQPQTGSSSNISVVNGNVVKNYTYTETRQFRATKKGTFSIPVASIKIDGKTYRSKAQNIEVYNISEWEEIQKKSVQNIFDTTINGSTGVAVIDSFLATRKGKKPINTVQDLYNDPEWIASCSKEIGDLFDTRVGYKPAGPMWEGNTPNKVPEEYRGLFTLDEVVNLSPEEFQEKLDKLKAERKKYHGQNNTLWIILILLGLPLYIWEIFFCAEKAESKNRTPAIWATWGLIFPIISVFAVLMIDTKINWESE